MNKMQQQVREFKEKLNGTDDWTVACDLIKEEAGELVAALNLWGDVQLQDDLVEQALVLDGMCDLIYVVFYFAEVIGIDLEPYFDEVQRTNLLKERGTGDHKIRKPEGWEPPQIARMLQEGIGRV